MGTFYTPTAWNLRPPNPGERIVDSNGAPTANEQEYRTNLGKLLQLISGIRVNVVGSDGTDSIQAAINQAGQQGGGVVILPARPFTMGQVTIPVGPPIWVMGQGPATMVTRRGNITPGQGLWDVYSSNFAMSDFLIDGGTTDPVGLTYGSGFSTSLAASDPMAPSLTTNTSVWVHGSASGFRFQNMIFQHAGGYSILLDALTGTISDIDILNCWFRNNRPTLFGKSTTPLIYGSWNGGVFAKGDGRALTGARSGVIQNFLVQGCRFERNTGNCLWSHNWGFQRFNSGFRWIGNRFLDTGLDAMLVTCVDNGVVAGNSLRRVGYTTINDTDKSVPRWLDGFSATGLDTGVTKGVAYVGNSFLNVNGGFVDLDGYGEGSIDSNVCKVSLPDEPEYIEDDLAISGILGTGPTCDGMTMGNTYNAPHGCNSVGFHGNTMLNIPTGSFRLFSARGCDLSGNIVVCPDAPLEPPITMGPQAVGPYKRCYQNKLHHNQFSYSPAAPAPFVKEDESQGTFDPGDINQVFGNNPINGASGLAIEFEPSVNSGSPTYLDTVWFT